MKILINLKRNTCRNDCKNRKIEKIKTQTKETEEDEKGNAHEN